MGKVTGVFLILAGVGTAALVLPAVDNESERQLGDVIRIATGNPAVSPTTAQSPQVPLIVAQPKVDGRALLPDAKNSREAVTPTGRSTLSLQAMPTPPGATTNTVPANTVPMAVAAAASQKADPPPVLIAPPQLTTRNANAAPVRPEDDQARQSLARDIQRELKRVGCYDGDLSGDWNTATRRAMKLFIDKVNAALPSDAPDHILRTMVQGHPGNACGKSGTVIAASPRAPVKVAEKSAEPIIRDLPQIATARPVVPKPSWETSVAATSVKPLDTQGRMAIGGPDLRSAAPIVTAPEPKLVARAPTALAPVAPPLPSAGTEKASARIVTPGAIAALSRTRDNSGAIGTGSVALPGAIESAPAMLIDPPKRVEAAAIEPKSGRDMRGVRDARADDQDTARRERQRQAVRRSPPPETFKYPSYVGVTSPKYFVTQSSSGKSNFSAQFFYNQRRDGSQR